VNIKCNYALQSLSLTNNNKNLTNERPKRTLNTKLSSEIGFTLQQGIADERLNLR